MPADRTKSRKAKRAAAFKQEPEPAPSASPTSRARPTSHRSLRDQRLWREAAIYYAATAWLGCLPEDAARLAAALIGSATIKIAPEKIIKAGEFKGRETEGLSLVYGTSYKSRRDGISSLQNRAKHILETVPAMIDGASDDDKIWLDLSLQGLRGLYFAVRDFNAEGIEAANALLHKIGWRSRAELFLKGQRYQRARLELS
jgi:hypothetical protein